MSAPQAPPPLWTVRDAARVYGVPERTIRHWVTKGALEAVRTGGTLRIVPPQEVRV